MRTRLLATIRSNLPDFALVLGVGGVFAGCMMLSVPVGLIVGGVFLVVLGLALGGK